jgi:hypothetical protein
MASAIDLLDNFVNVVGNALPPLPPDPSTLGTFTPDLSKLQRDRDIIMMPQKECGEIRPDLDGGDSAHREGVAAFCNSDRDKKLLDLFEDRKGVMVRHPTQVPWNESDNCTMDQLRGFMVGCWRAGRADIARRLLVAHEARNWHCQNIFAPERCPKVTRSSPKPPDVLLPHEIMCLHIAAGDSEAYLDPLGQFWLYIAIQIAKKDKEEDNNNLMFESIVCGRLNVFVAAHTNWRDFVKFYWRSQAPLGDAVIAVVEKELERYPRDAKIDLLPTEQLKLIKSLDAYTELMNVDPGHRAQLAARFAEAAIKDAAKFFINVRKLSVQEAIKRLKALIPKNQNLQAIAQQLVKALHDGRIPAPANVIKTGLAAAGFPPDVIDHAIRTISPGEGIPVPVPVPIPVPIPVPPLPIPHPRWPF